MDYKLCETTQFNLYHSGKTIIYLLMHKSLKRKFREMYLGRYDKLWDTVQYRCYKNEI